MSMPTQPEALRLADELEDTTCLWSPSVNRARVDKAAAELRRQHGEIKSMRTERLRSERRLSAVEAQRDALLEALKYLDKEFRQHGRQHWPEAVRVRAAIKTVEEQK